MCEFINQNSIKLVNFKDEDIKKLIENGDMEKLAGLVLNGQGHKLDGFKSDHPEIQSFLDNVPAYMVNFY